MPASCRRTRRGRKALLLAELALRTELSEAVARLSAIVAALKRARFGRRSEKLDVDQLELALEDTGQRKTPVRCSPKSGPLRIAIGEYVSDGWSIP